MIKVKYIIQAINGYNYLQNCMDEKGMVPQPKTRIYFSRDLFWLVRNLLRPTVVQDCPVKFLFLNFAWYSVSSSA